MEIVAILDNIRSLHNVGSIFRTADGAGVKKIYLTGITPSPVNRFKKVRPQIQKVALGAEATVPWEKVSTTEAVIERLKDEDYKIYALEQSVGSVPYYKVKLKAGEKIAFILGAEVAGLSKTAISLADRIVEIPMRGQLIRHADHPKNQSAGNKESLNVAVAFGIVVYHFNYGFKQDF
jgi:23S rRNA (guanosine2251-2'-O)-methyltransferase